MDSIKIKEKSYLILGLALIGGSGYGGYKLIAKIWAQLLSLDKQLSVALLTAFTTVIVATLTVMLGRYLERKKSSPTSGRAKFKCMMNF